MKPLTYTPCPGPLISMSSLVCTEFEWGLHYFPDYHQTSTWVPYWFRFGWWSLGKGAYHSQTPFDRGRAPASINDAPNKRLPPVDITAADAVTPTYRPRDGRKPPPPTYSTRTPTAVSSTWWLMACTRKERSVYRILHTRWT